MTADVLALGDTPAVALRTSIEAVLDAPQFLYRTELGTNAQAAGSLTPHELADQLAFFLTDAPPDAELLAAAENNELSNSQQLSGQLRRLLQKPAVKQNLQDALFASFRLAALNTVVIDSPDFTPQVRESMQREAERFLASTLWSEPVSELLTSRRSSINATLAPLYDFGPFPPSGVTPDADGFAFVELPVNRAAS